VGVSAINQLNSEVAMIAAVRGLVEALASGSHLQHSRLNQLKEGSEEVSPSSSPYSLIQAILKAIVPAPAAR